jgi:YwiC-like protein
MLLQPFLASLLVLHQLTWQVAPALGAVILVFLAREPLIVLARQKWVWRGERPESAAAQRYLAVELFLLALCGALLLTIWPVWVLGTLGGAAAALTAIAVYMTVRNRQRAVWLQALSAAGLSSSALAACLATAPAIPVWGWWMWGLHAGHFLAAILVVHARLEARIALRKPGGRLTEAFFAMRRQATVVQVGMVIAAVTLFAIGRWFYGAALAGSAMFHFADLYNLHSARALSLPMRTVGKRALSASIMFTLLAVAGSW